MVKSHDTATVSMCLSRPRTEVVLLCVLTTQTRDPKAPQQKAAVCS